MDHDTIDETTVPAVPATRTVRVAGGA